MPSMQLSARSFLFGVLIPPALFSGAVRVFADTSMPVPVSVVCEWVRLPHARANELLRNHACSSGAGTLREATLAMIRNKSALRLDLQCLQLVSGMSASTGDTVTYYRRSGGDPPQVPQAVSMEGAWPFELSVPAVMGSTHPLKLGREIQVAAFPANAPGPPELNAVITWTEAVTEIALGEGVSRYAHPVYYQAASRFRPGCAGGNWQLAALFTPPPATAPDLSPRQMQLPEDRVFVFIRASASPEAAALPPAAPGFCVLAEWIEVDATLLPELLARTPDLSVAASMRHALDTPPEPGMVKLVETAFRHLQPEASTESLLYYPEPAETDPPAGPQTLTLKNTVPSGAKAAPAPGHPVFFQTIQNVPLGSTLKVALAAREEDGAVRLEITAGLTSLHGIDTYGKAPSAVPLLRTGERRTVTELCAQPGVPALAGIMDAVLPPGETVPDVRSRKLLLFVTVLR